MNEPAETRGGQLDEKTEINLWLKEFKQKFQPVGQILDSSYKADMLDGLEKNLEACWSLGAIEGSPVCDLLRRGKELISRVRVQRKESFSSLLAEFIRSLKARNIPLKEFNQSWRAGFLKEGSSEWWESGAIDIKYNALASTATTSYCDVPLVDPQEVTSAEDLEKLLQTSVKLLEKLKFDKVYTLEIFEEAMQRCCKQVGAHLVPIQDFYLEIGACLTRQRLARRKGIPSASDYGKLQFTVLCDQYRINSGTVPSEKRVHFETGGQSTIQKGSSFTLCSIGSQEQKLFSFVSWGRK